MNNNNFIFPIPLDFPLFQGTIFLQSEFVKNAFFQHSDAISSRPCGW